MTNIELYRAARVRMMEVATGADGTATVPACPDWSIRDLLAHVTGVADDVANGRLEGVGTDPWTHVQVLARADRTLAEVLAEWAVVGPQMEEAVTIFGDAPDQLVFDTVTHEHDLRHAVGAAGPKDAASLDVALKWVGEAWTLSAERGAGTMRIDAGAHRFDLGDGAPEVVVTVPAFEALRMLTGRRSAQEICAYRASGSIEPWLGSFTWGPFSLRTTPLDET